jgi:hypothetical protein
LCAVRRGKPGFSPMLQSVELDAAFGTKLQAVTVGIWHRFSAD